MKEAAPLSLGEVRLAFLGGERLASELGRFAEVRRLRLRDRASPSNPVRLTGGLAHCLVVEGGTDLGPGRAERLAGLLDRFAEVEVPRALWLTASDPDPALLRHWDRFNQVFTVDPAHLSSLEDVGRAPLAPLPKAVSQPFFRVASEDAVDRPYGVAWLGAWRNDWPRVWTERAIAILRAAASHGLRVFGTPDPDVLPADLRQYCHDSAAPMGDVLRRAKIAIAIDRRSSSRHVVPPVVFDAIASGAAVISPHDYGLSSVFRDLMPVVVDRQSASMAIKTLEANPAARTKSVQKCREIVALNHTYAHRLATIVSSVGYAVAPDAASIPAHS